MQASSDFFRILFVEDHEEDSLLMMHTLSKAGLRLETHRVASANDLRAALKEKSWDIIISDYFIPGFGGLEALTIVQEIEPSLPFVLVSGSIGEENAVEAIRLGARDYLIKDRLVRLPSVVRREINDARESVLRQAAKKEARESRENLERLKRFFPGGVAERIATGRQVNPFEWHRKDVTVLFVDLHGFTSFVELSEPEIVVQVLTDYYSWVAKAVLEFNGTIGHVAGDGIMIFFNDPIDIPNPQEMAVRTGIRIRDELKILKQRWSDMAYSIDFGAGIASGFATVGGIGAEGCWDYSVIGTVTNVAQRLCSLAQNGQILIPQRVVQYVSSFTEVAPLGAQELKGLHGPLTVYDIVKIKTPENSDA